ncbi:MAG: methyltransferase domain-containing protein [Gammaproteobacteria bacterium]|nr:methyltransferase domain-containing protein [Gammaproteobacteria bacterium]
MCNACIPLLNDAKPVEPFADQLMNMLNQGALSLMVSIGHRTGLFDSMAELKETTVQKITNHAGLEKRYVKEWLAAMVVGGIVYYRPDKKTYQLPQSHADLLTRTASPDNIAVYLQYISILGQVEDRIVNCFRQGGGVDYEHFLGFHAVMAEDSSQTVVSALEENIIPLVNQLEPDLERGISVLDVGCGRGRALSYLAKRYPNSKFTGFDLSAEALADAHQYAQQRGLSNVTFIERDLTSFNQQAEENQFEWVTAFDAIHDQVEPQNVLNGIYKTLKPGGTFLMQDIRASSNLENNLKHPIAPFLYTISTMHCMTVSLAQDGAGLGTMWGEELAMEMLGKAGFAKIEVNQLEHDFQNNFYVMSK